MMLDSGIAPVLSLGLFMGARHALDVDHLAAISTITSESLSLRRSCAIGACWGIGHALMILLAGVAVLSFKLTISDHWATFFEACAGIMLIGLGFSVGLSLLREHLHGHPHRNEGEQASHFHLHAHHDGLAHSHNHRHGLELKSLAIGIVHGLAGSAVVSLAAVSGSHSVAEGILYLLLFGLGSIGGMVLLGGLLTLPLTLTAQKWAQAQVAVKLVAGVASIIVGGNILFSVA